MWPLAYRTPLTSKLSIKSRIAFCSSAVRVILPASIDCLTRSGLVCRDADAVSDRSAAWTLGAVTHRARQRHNALPLRRDPGNRQLSRSDVLLLGNLFELAGKLHVVLKVLVGELVKVATHVAYGRGADQYETSLELAGRQRTFGNVLLALPASEETGSDGTASDGARLSLEPHPQAGRFQAHE